MVHISFDYANDMRNMDVKSSSYAEKTTTSYTANAVHGRSAEGYRLDISGKVMDNNAYGGHGKTTEEIMSQAAQADVITQKNYMAVMSNTLSDEDFARLQKDGHEPSGMEAGETVTIVDKIKAEMAKAGTIVAGYTDDIDTETLAAITGSLSFANELSKEFARQDIPMTQDNEKEVEIAFKQSGTLQDISDSSIKYMIENDLAPTIDNLYKASYSAVGDGNRQAKGYFREETGNYLGKKADVVDEATIRPQIEKFLADNGYAEDEVNVKDALWLVEKGIPLTVDNLDQYKELSSLTLPLEEQDLAHAITSAIADGKRGIDANLVDIESNMEKAVAVLEKYQKEDYVSDKEYASVEVQNQNLQARLQLEQVRMKMTVEANYKLLQSGFSIDTAPISELIEALEKAIKDTNDLMFGKDIPVEQGYDLYQDVLAKTAQIETFPISTIGSVVYDRLQDEGTYNLQNVYDRGLEAKAQFEKAGSAYEEMMTEVRPDLGDSIRKAFRNVDDILKEMSRELSEENKQAVRILSYNNMEISDSNLDRIVEANKTVHSVMSHMTPANTMKLIREGVNPLTVNLDELEQKLASYETTPIKETEKYSRFLYNLEKDKAISEAEKEAYIGIYRLMRQIEKTDSAAVGALLESGTQINLENIMTAIRSSKKVGMDYKVGDDFSGVNAAGDGKSITEQIQNAFEEILKNQEENADNNYQKEQLQEYRQAAQVEDETIEMLLEAKTPVTADHLNALQLMRNSKGRWIKDIEEYLPQENRLVDSLTGKEEFVQEYTSYIEEATNRLNQAIFDETNPTYLDIKEKQSWMKVLHVTSAMSKEESYEIPYETEDGMSALHLTIRHGDGEDVGLSVDMTKEAYGHVKMEITVLQDQVKAFVLYENMQGSEEINTKAKDMEETLSTIFDKKVSIEALQKDNIDHVSMKGLTPGKIKMNEKIRTDAAEKAEKVQISDDILYRAAKTIITSISR